MGDARFRPGLWIWLCGWLLAAGFAGWHALAVDRYLDRVSETRFTSNDAETPLRRVPQAIAPDGQIWVRHAIGLAESGGWRLRSTMADNAQEGRAIYWNSGWALWLEACGRMRALFTDEPLPMAIEEAAQWANLPLFLLVLTLASGWTWRRWGGAAGAVVALGMAGHRSFYAGFYPAYADHHGLIAACVLGVVLGAAMAGAGWRRVAPDAALLPESEREAVRAMIVSALCGAAGMWASAAALVVTIGLVGSAGALIGLRGMAGGAGVPQAWRMWGRVGALGSVVFYLLENFPDRLGFRLEANHPLYALAWWGAGEGIAALLEWKSGRRSRTWLARRLAGWGALVAAAPAAILAGGAAVFAPLEPFLSRIHDSIHEFAPLWAEIDRSGWGAYRDQVWIPAILFAVALVIWVLLRKRPGAAFVGFALAVAMAATLQGVMQNRWLLTAGAPQVVLGAVLAAVLTRDGSGRRALLTVAVAAGLFVAGPWTLVRERLHVERVRDVQFGETVQLLYRDIAGALRRAGADERSVVLSDPNASVGVGYYGRLGTVGTLYWENRDGLLAAARMLDAVDDAEAAALIHARGVTHVALVSSYDFLDEYHAALHEGGEAGENAAGLGKRLLYAHDVPTWLRPLNYRVPAPLQPLGIKVALFAVDFETPVAVARERIGRYQLSRGARELAEKSFMAAMAADATLPAPWLRLGELALADGRVKEAFHFIRAGVERAPATERARLATQAAALFERAGAVAEAEALESAAR